MRKAAQVERIQHPIGADTALARHSQTPAHQVEFGGGMGVGIDAENATQPVLVLTYLADPIAPLQVKALEEAARSLGVTLQNATLSFPKIRSGLGVASSGRIIA
jgi:hypothetical protein